MNANKENDMEHRTNWTLTLRDRDGFDVIRVTYLRGLTYTEAAANCERRGGDWTLTPGAPE